MRGQVLDNWRGASAVAAVVAAAVAVALAAGCTSHSSVPTPQTTSGVTAGGAGAAPSPRTVTPSARSAAPATVAPPAQPAQLPDLAAPDYTPATRTEELEQQIDTSGSPTLQQAIDVFSLSMAPLPGATTSDMPPGGGFSPTVATAMIEPYRSHLSPEQQRIVDGFAGTVIADVGLDGYSVLTRTSGTAGSGGASTGASGATSPTKSVTTSSPPVTSTAPGLRRSNVSVAPTPALQHDLKLLEQVLNDWVAYKPEYRGKLQDPTTKQAHVQVALSTVQPQGEHAHDEMQTSASDTDPHGCVITMLPVFTNGTYSDDLAKYIFAHEVFHCIQFTWSNLSSDPDWLVEGSAEFAASDLYRTRFAPSKGEPFDGWFSEPQYPLGQETDKGYGDWALFEAFKQHYGGDVYPLIEKMIETTGSTATILAAGNFTDPVFATLWTSTSLRSTIYSDKVFQLQWPGVEPDFGTRDTAQYLGDRGIGMFAVKGKPDFVHQQYSVGFDRTVGVVGVVPQGGPMLTEADAGPFTVGEGQQAWFCVRAGGCTCTDGTTPWLTLEPLTPLMLFSFPATVNPTDAAVTTLPWEPDRYCRPGREPPAPAPGGRSNGDPHVTTYNGLTYDFMTYGEFVTSQDTTGGFTVQERHIHAGFGTAISAVAVGDGHHRITLTEPTIYGSQATTVRVDGLVDTSKALTAGSMKLRATGDDDWTVTWTDGSAVTAHWGEGFFLTVAPSAQRASHLIGLLGTPGRTFLNDLSVPGGQPADPADHYQAFVDAYEVTTATTLFDYEADESPATVATPPANLAPVNQPTPATVASCRSALSDGATTAEINACAYDITSVGPDSASAYQRAYAAVTRQRVSQIVPRPDREPPPPIAVGTAAPTSATTAVGATTEYGTASAGSTLNLTGTLDPNDPASTLGGRMTLAAGAVLVVKAQCPKVNGLDVTLSIAGVDSGSPVRPPLCGSPWQDRVGHDIQRPFFAGETGSATNGETYLYISFAGDYDIAIHASNDDPAKPAAAASVRVQLVSSPSPTVVVASTLASGASATATLATVGSTVDIQLPSSSTDTWIWTFTGNGNLCTRQYQDLVIAAGTPANAPVDLGPVCWRNDDITVDPGDHASEPFVVFNRDGSTHQVTITRTRWG